MEKPQEREVGYCERCGSMLLWLTIVALGYRCMCGSTHVSRGTTGARYKVNE